MKKIFLSAILLATSTLFAQVGIGTTTPAGSSILDLTATNKALLLTREANTAAITTPVNGMMIYDISENCIKGYENGAWSGCLSSNLPVGVISTLDCAGATTTGTLTNTIAASGVSSSIPYTGGNGSAHSGQVVAFTGVLGLTATLLSGTFATGAGSLAYTITGTPTSSGTTNFALNIGGKSCTLNIAVAVLCVNPNTVPAGYTDNFAILYNTNQVTWNQLRTGNGILTDILPSHFASATPYDIAIRDNDSHFGANGPQAVDATPHSVISISPGLVIPSNSRMSFYCNRSGNVTVGGQPVWSEGPVDIDSPSTINYSIQGQYAPNPERTDLGTYASVTATNATGSTNYIIYKVTIAGVSGTYFYVVAQSSTVSPKVLLNNATTITDNGISNWGPADLSYPNSPNTALAWRIGIQGVSTPASCN